MIFCMNLNWNKFILLYDTIAGFNKQKVLYGTKDGHLGLVDLSPESGTLLWEIPTKSTSGIYSMLFLIKQFSLKISTITIYVIRIFWRIDNA